MFYSLLRNIFLIDFRVPGQTADGTSRTIINFTRHLYIMEKFKTKMVIKKCYFKPGNDGPKYKKRPFHDRKLQKPDG